MIKVTYLDHSGFVVATPQAYLVFDFYKDPDKKFEHAIDADRKLPVIFFVSHHHPDHFNKSIFELCQDRDHAYVLSNDIFSDLVPQKGLSVAWVSAGDVIDSLPGGITVKAYGSTDAGVSFMVTLADGSRVFHAGDLNDWHWQDESSERELRKQSRNSRPSWTASPPRCPKSRSPCSPSTPVRVPTSHAEPKFSSRA